MRLFSSPRALLSKKMQYFYAKRAPRQDEAVLTLRNVYIFFSREGLLYAFLLLITFITGVNYGNNLVLGLCFYLTSIWVISLHLTFAHIAGLRMALRDAPLTQAGKLAWVTIEISNDKSKPSRQLHLSFDKQTSKVEKIASQDNIIASLQGTTRVSLPLATVKRGKMQLPRVKIDTVYPLGIMRAWSYVYFASPIWVYPKPLPFDWQEALASVSDEDNEWSVHVAQGQNDFDTLDEYVEGESLARVSWAHAARGQGMLTKQFADAKGKKMHLSYADMPATTHEDKLAQLTYAVLLASESNEAFALQLPDGHSAQIGQGDAFVNACLLRLAKAP